MYIMSTLANAPKCEATPIDFPEPRQTRRSMKHTHPYDMLRLCPSWAGFIARDGFIWTPDGDHYSAHQVRSIGYRKELCLELARRLREPGQLELIL